MGAASPTLRRPSIAAMIGGIMRTQGSDTPDAAVLEAFGLVPQSLRPAASGLINRTWYAHTTDSRDVVLQRVNPIFPPEINADIDAVTRHLAARGLPTPRVVPTRSGSLWLTYGGYAWRTLTAVEGITRDALGSEHQAEEAGRVLAAFHRAVADLDIRFANARLGVHDTARHLRNLETALARHADHAAYPLVAPLAADVLAAGRALPALPAAPDRIVHGDPKVSNIVFEPDTDRAVCLIDLDTLARMPVALELGDAVRSWCHPGTEDKAGAEISVPLFHAAMRGYAREARGLLTEPEWTAIADATLTITVELAARFCADALNESYFGWDAQRFPTSSAHNQARTRCQLSLAASIRAKRAVLQAVLEAEFAPHRLARGP